MGAKHRTGTGYSTGEERTGIAYEQSRDCTLSPKQGDQIDHLCHRRFCIQPAHLYLGDAKTNAEDRKALRSENAKYRTRDQVEDRFDKAMTEHHFTSDRANFPRVRRATGMPT